MRGYWSPKIRWLMTIAILLIVMAACTRTISPTSAPVAQTPSPVSLIPLQTPGLKVTPKPTPVPLEPLSISQRWIVEPWERLVARSSEASISVHKIILTSDYITIFYSVEVLRPDFVGRVFLLDTTRLITETQDKKYEATSIQSLGYASGTTFGSITFGPYQEGNMSLTLSILGLALRNIVGGSDLFVPGPWEIPLLNNRRPDEPVHYIWSIRGRVASDGGVVTRFPSHEFAGTLPGNEHLVHPFTVGDKELYFLLDHEGKPYSLIPISAAVPARFPPDVISEP